MKRERFSIQLVGASPLVMHNNTLVDPLHPLKKQIAKITAKRTGKTEADIARLYRLEFEGGLYHDPKLGPYIPTRCLRKMLIEGAKKFRGGKKFEQGLIVLDDAPIQYDGPRDIEGLWEAGFRWTTVCGNQSASIMRTRPRFEDWSVTFEVEIESDVLSAEEISQALYHATLIGLCDGRSLGFGRFDYEVTPVGSPEPKRRSIDIDVDEPAASLAS